MELPSVDIASSNAIQSIEQKRLLLKRVVAIVRSIQRIQDSLKAVLILGEATTGIPKNALHFFRKLSTSIRTQPTETIKQYFDRLEVLIKGEFRRVLRYAQVSQEAEPGTENSDYAEQFQSEQGLKFLKEFKRRAQTAVSLKVLLLDRGIETSPAALPVPIQAIRKRMVQLDLKKKNHIGKVKTQISDMRKDLLAMMNRNGYSEEMRSVIKQVVEGLESDINALESGQDLEGLSFSFETFETGANKNAGKSPRKKENASQRKETAQQAVAAKRKTGSDAIKSARKSKQPGFLALLKRWFNAPWNVGWREIKKERQL